MVALGSATMSLPPDDHGGIGDDDPGDESVESSSGGPPHPMDRVWRHPSELPALAEPAPGPPRTPAPEWARSMFAWVGAGVLGAMLTVGVLAAAGVLDQRVATNVANRPTNPGRTQNEVAAMARRIAPAIVAVRVVDRLGRSRTGSGVCIRNAGQVLTSDRLLTGYRRIDIVTADGKVHTARMIGRDPESDLALVAIDGDLEAADLAASNSLGLGEAVYAIGADSSGAPWVSEGIVSSLAGRVATKTTTMSGLIESNALTEPAVAGGALLDEDGRVAGILMTTVSGHPAAIAVPIRFASEVADGLRANGRVDHGWMGLGGRVIAGGRLQITTLAKGGPAERAGIRLGDVVMSADSQRITSIDDLMATARGHWPGDPIRLDVTRGHSGLSVTVKLARRPRFVTPTSTPTTTPTTQPLSPTTGP